VDLVGWLAMKNFVLFPANLKNDINSILRFLKKMKDERLRNFPFARQKTFVNLGFKFKKQKVFHLTSKI